jgi:endonuclease/exonuclease/phosphatase family metal-dependent hydrolase
VRETSRSVRIKVITYNIHRAIGVDRRFRPERVLEVLAHYGADLVLLQEVDDGVPRSRELDLAGELAREAGYPYYAVGHNVSLRKGRYGNATLSRFPILRERNIDLTIPNQNLAGSWIRRGCQHTSLALDEREDGARLEVFNLHLGLSAREREKQMGLLFNSSEFRALDAGMPTLVGGDFNDWRSRLQPIFTEIFGFGCATGRRSGTGATPTYPSFSPQGALDRIYYRGGLHLAGAHRCRLRVSRVASDHLPVIAEFDVR